MTYRGLVALAWLAALAWGSPGRAAEERLNVLFIAVDDLRPELGCYGAPVQSPNIDGLAATGALFERAYCQVALCHPSRESLLSGRRPETTRVYAFDTSTRDVLPDVVMLPQHFKQHGYDARGFGKVFHKNDPRSWSVPAWKSDRPQYHTEFGRRVLRWIRDDYRRLTFTWELGDGHTKSKRMGGLPWEAPKVADSALREGHMTDEVLGVLDQVRTRPFFLAVGYHKPHLPFVAPRRYFERYDPERIPLAPNPFPPEDAPAFAVYNFNDMRHYYGIPKIGPVLDDQARDLKLAYYACVSYVDAQIGRLLDALKRLGLAERTVVVLWGDHGWQLGEHGIWDKHTNFETSTRAPLIVRVPGQEPGRCAGLVEFVDVYPSLCDLCGLPQPQGLEGKSFGPLIRDPDEPWKEAAFSQYRRVIPGHGLGMGYSMRTDRWRYTEWHGEGGELVARELYDHAADPEENVNVASRPKHADLVARLSRTLRAAMRLPPPPEAWPRSSPGCPPRPARGSPARCSASTAASPTSAPVRRSNPRPPFHPSSPFKCWISCQRRPSNSALRRSIWRGS